MHMEQVTDLERRDNPIFHTGYSNSPNQARFFT